MAQQEKGKTEKIILVFNRSLFAISETFIYRQVVSLNKHFRLKLVGLEIKPQSFFNVSDFELLKVNVRASLFRRVIGYGYRKLFRRKLSLFPFIKSSLDEALPSARDIIMHVHYGWNAVLLLPYLKARTIPMAVSFHGSDASQWLSRKAYKSKLPALFEYSSAIIVCSEHMIEALELRAYMDKVHLIPYGINTTEFKFSPTNRESEEIVILHSGRLVPKKGVPDLIKAFSLVTNSAKVKLQIVGDGSDKDECERLVDELNLRDRVVFFGTQPLSTVKQLMNECDIFALNSRIDSQGDMEGLPNSILEAMAFEKPVVATLHAGIPMAVVNNETGLLVRERDITALTAALEKLIGNKKLRQEFGVRGRERVLSIFSDEVMEGSLKAVFDKIITSA